MREGLTASEMSAQTPLHPALVQLIEILARQMVADYLTEVRSANHELGADGENHVALPRLDEAA